MIAPFVIIYIFNWIVFIIIFSSLLRKSCNKKLREAKEFDKKGSEKKSQLKQQFLIAITLSILFGLGWGVGLPATQSFHDTAVISDIFSAFFVLFTSFQGLFIFIMHCLRSPEIRKVWAGWFKLATGKEVNEFTTSVTTKPSKRKNIEKFQNKERVNTRSTANAHDEFSFASGNDDDNRYTTLQRNVQKSGLLDSMGTLERFGQGIPVTLPFIVEDEEEGEKPCRIPSPILIENINITQSDEDFDIAADLSYGVKSFQLPEGVFGYNFADSASLGGMTVISEDGKECTVFENPMEMQQLDPFSKFDGMSYSQSQYSFRSADILDHTQTSFTNPLMSEYDQ